MGFEPRPLCMSFLASGKFRLIFQVCVQGHLLRKPSEITPGHSSTEPAGPRAPTALSCKWLVACLPLMHTSLSPNPGGTRCHCCPVSQTGPGLLQGDLYWQSLSLNLRSNSQGEAGGSEFTAQSPVAEGQVGEAGAMTDGPEQTSFIHRQNCDSMDRASRSPGPMSKTDQEPTFLW